MTTMQTDAIGSRKPVRLWPGVVAVALQWFAWQALPALVPEAAMYGILGGVFGGGAAVLLWWLFFSRTPWLERLGALVLIPAAVFGTYFLVHPSIANGAMGLMLPLYSIPVLCLALVVWAGATRRLSAGFRRAALVAAILVACAGFAVVRTGGMSGEGDADLHWRWTPTPEERLLASDAEATARASARVERTAAADWPGFRGPGRDGVVRGAHVATDWSTSPPVELWRRAVGPAWSSFAVQGDLFYTQEQRGEEEVVACYRVSTGQPVWRHADSVRFWESNAGPGPRATPTLHKGRVYTLGATGIVNALDAADGTVAWTCNATADTGSKVPNWAFAGSPLVVDDVVILATAGRLVAYDAASGKRRWVITEGGGGYSSPHLATIAGARQVLLYKGAGLISVLPQTGAKLWEYAWQSDGIVQPALLPDGGLLLGSGSGLNGGNGVRRLAVAKTDGGWTTTEGWTSIGLKPYFNDFVLDKGHAYGFDGGFLACIDVADGKRKWKGGRYGHGQALALADQDMLLVLSEKGELALVAAKPDQFRELGRHKAIEGKTWNHPVLVGDVVLVRNDQEMAAFRLAPEGQRAGVGQ